VKKYAKLREQAISAVQQYKQEVESGAFPADEHCFK